MLRFFRNFFGLNLIFVTVSIARNVAIVVDDYDQHNQQRANRAESALRTRGYQVVRVRSVQVPMSRFTVAERINQEIERLNLGAQDKIILDFQCHGTVADETPQDWLDHIKCLDREESHTSALNLDDIRSFVGRIRRSRAQVAVLDHSCGGGATVLALRGLRGVCALSATSAQYSATLFRNSSAGVRIESTLEEELRQRQVQNLEDMGLFYHVSLIATDRTVGAISTDGSTPEGRREGNAFMQIPMRTGCHVGFLPRQLRNLSISAVNASNRLFDFMKGPEWLGSVVSLPLLDTVVSRRGEQVCQLSEVLDRSLQNWIAFMQQIQIHQLDSAVANLFPRMGSAFRAAGVQVPTHSRYDLATLWSDVRLINARLIALTRNQQEILTEMNATLVQIDRIRLWNRIARYRLNLPLDDPRPPNRELSQLMMRARALRSQFSGFQQDALNLYTQIAALVAIANQSVCTAQDTAGDTACRDFQL